MNAGPRCGRALPTLLLVSLLAGAVEAQQYPTKPIRIVIPFPPGGTNDLVPRAIAEKLRVTLGQPVVPENRPGGNNIIGSEIVAKSVPDGHTLLIANTQHVINPSLFPKLPYDALKDFTAVGLATSVYFALTVHPSVPAANVKELVAYARQNPGKLNYGSAGSGSATHLNMELFKSMTGTFIVHIPYRGSTQSRQDLVAGEVQLSVDGLLPTLPLIRAGKLKAFGLTSSRRSSVAPEIPTLAEAGVTGYASDTWYGIMAPAGTPKEIVQALHAAAVKSIGMPALRERLTQQGAELVGSTPDEFRKLLEREFVLWAKVVKQSGAKVD